VAAGGAGEVFSLTAAEHEAVIRATVRNAAGLPVVGVRVRLVVTGTCLTH
jgi:dihydrodipicolinate synthase/N-acetylneuraminate lyase